MAVRAFDITDVSTASVSVFERPAPTRRDTRRLRHHHATVALVSLAVPFVVALVVVGVGH
jgi:hypothetical protein